ncbi:disulfide isomerase-like 1-4 [Micractinium conductrix]|uniref:Protein disulfide-isomerase n=1 Tax=Micractinium conductrix TaxID=554055 RepID=A0A2P6VND0_9CHLO|nr:disulfide isomerase-like 1-4 [Micractinium conductrix]|eukprot:PSC75600.1 disulfide isomerase-like 1-4 [Micractinium conductrix]
MSRRTVLGLLLLCAAAVAVRGDDDGVDESAVVVLKDAEFEKHIGSKKYMLVEFYAPWCGHCKALKPEYAKAALALKDYSEDVGLAKVDATEEKEIAGKFEIQGYPTLKWFIDGKEASDYSGGRTADDIVRWIKKKTGPATTEIADVEALEKAKKESTVILLGYFDKYEGDDHTAYEAAAQKSDDAAFLKTTSAEVAKAMGLEKPGFALGRSYPDFGFETVSAEGHKAVDDALDLGDGLEAFIKAEKLPAFTEFSQDTSSAIFGSGINSQVIVTAPGELFAKDGELFKTLVGVSSKLKGKVVLVTAKTESDNGKPIMDYFGLSKDATEPQVVGFDSGAGKKFKFEGAVTVEALTKFAEDVIEGKATKFFKSAAEPAEPLDKGVAVVTGNTVESIVKDAKKDVLLEVYAPWCGHCKSLAPIYEKLAKRFAKIDSVVIAKMDGTENEHPDIEASGYPTLMFFPAEEGAEPIPYDGGRTLGEMTKFIKKNAKVPFELPKKKKSKDAEKEEAKEEEETKDEL